VLLLVAGDEGRLLARRVRVSVGLLCARLVVVALAIRLRGWGGLAAGASLGSGALLLHVVLALRRALLLLLWLRCLLLGVVIVGALFVVNLLNLK
jgi:hypothetical protein